MPGQWASWGNPSTTGIPTIDYYGSNAQLDILFYTDIGMDSFTYTLAHSRLAPVQCVTWGHPSTTGIPTIDYYISSEALETEGAEQCYTETLVQLRNLPIYY